MIVAVPITCSVVWTGGVSSTGATLRVALAALVLGSPAGVSRSLGVANSCATSFGIGGKLFFMIAGASCQIGIIAFTVAS